MQADSFNFPRDADVQQTQILCDDLRQRAQTMVQEEVLLGQLIVATDPLRPNQASRYRAMLTSVRMRYDQLRTVIDRYCR